MRFRGYLGALALLVVTPTVAAAQFTTFVAPPRPAPEVDVTADPAVRAHADSMRAQTRTSMQAWVDSVAGELDVVVDTAHHDSVYVAGGVSGTPRHGQAQAGTQRQPTRTTAFREGAPAPDTATSLPLLALIGFGAATIGAALLWRTHA